MQVAEGRQKRGAQDPMCLPNLSFKKKKVFFYLLDILEMDFEWIFEATFFRVAVTPSPCVSNGYLLDTI